MKKIFFVLLLILSNFYQVSAESNFETDYTLIDCVNWNNDTWVAFDSAMPYTTLKSWIENTINYINSNVNKVWNELTASWKLFNIKVQCSFNDILNKSINLDFNWVTYNNELILEWIWNNSFIIKDTDFQLWYLAWNIVFKNAIFLNEDKPYFYDDFFTYNKYTNSNPFSYWIKIIDSYIKLKNSNNIWNYWTYKMLKYINRNWIIDYFYFDNYTNKQFIENSVLDIEVDNNFIFRMPNFIKNSKITFNNISWTWIYDITFSEDGNIKSSSDLNYSVLVSNEIDLWWNNFLTEDTTNISFLNNKFFNFNEFDFSWNWIFINNFIENNLSIDISKFHNLYNNVLKSGFTDSYDIFNYRKNYSLNNIWNMWIGWVYKRIRDIKYFNIDINSASLYNEITGKDLPKWLWDIYVIFNY